MDGCYYIYNPPPTFSVRVSRNTLTSIFPFAGVMRAYQHLRTHVCVYAYQHTLTRVCVCASSELPYARLLAIMEKKGLPS